MTRYFNTEGNCTPAVHYMVNLDERLRDIKQFFVDRGKYFVINRGRQYGKTTTLQLLAKYLKTGYIVIFMDFQEIGSADFKDEASFATVFAKIFIRAWQNLHIENGDALAEPIAQFIHEKENPSLQELFARLSAVCENAPKPTVLIVDEVDSAGNNQVFLDFLGLLRTYYLDRENKPAFQSVILAGVYDIKNLKLKIRPDAEHQYNSPWNIAADFDIDMSFSARQIAAMLQDYEADRHIGFDVDAVALEIYQYTSGHPYLVSAICKLLDEKIAGNISIHGTLESWTKQDAWTKQDTQTKQNAWTKQDTRTKQNAWTKHGVAEAVKILLEERRPLFESMAKQLTEYPDMKHMLQAILFQGKRVTYNPDNLPIALASMFGYIVNIQNSIQVANRIFEMRLYNYFLSEEELTNALYDEAQGNRNQFIQNGRLDMELVLEKFTICFNDIYSEHDGKFIEEYGRKFFLLYLKPIINGVGNYYIEAQTRDARRTDVIVDYLGEQFIVELKIWRGNEYHKRGEQQLTDYLSYYHQDKGYLISFHFNKKKETGIKKMQINGKTIIEAIV